MKHDAVELRWLADGTYWLGGCLSANAQGQEVHYHVSSYLVVGSKATLLVDTGDPAHRALLLAQLELVLGERPLDYVFPTHPEIPHAGNLPALLDKYPGALVVGDVRDYHLHFPNTAPGSGHRRPEAGSILAIGSSASFRPSSGTWRTLSGATTTAPG
ncbi:anaerobic nitric oxide reductase [Arthrobacter sp. Hiyo8]|nr:anaerobic nitric oxide reductase [Arthrobacter sp. Hiyo8]